MRHCTHSYRTRVFATAALAAVASLAARGTLAAQGTAAPRTAVLAGTVVRDDSNATTAARPIANVTVTVAGETRAARTDAQGRFVITGLATGTREVAARGLGFAPLSVRAELSAGDTTWLDFALSPAVVALSKVTVRDSVAPLGNREFERRRAQGLGVYLTQAQLEKASGRRLSDVLRMTPGVQIVRLPCAKSTCGKFAVGTRRGLTSIRSAQVCLFQVYVDGVRVYAPQSDGGGDDPFNIDAYDVMVLGGIEVYAGGARTPPELNATGSSCGTIALWTRAR